MRRFPQTWPTYAFCAVVVVLTSTNLAKLPPGLPGAPLSVGPLLGLVLSAFAWQLFQVPKHWRECRWSGLLPLGLCLACVPFGFVVGRWLLDARFLLDRERYEAVAERVRNGTYSRATDDEFSEPVQGVQRGPGRLYGRIEHLLPEDASLGSWACPIWEDGKVVAVSFLVVSYGLGHGASFVRAYEGDVHGQYGRPIAPGWYETGRIRP